MLTTPLCVTRPPLSGHLRLTGTPARALAGHDLAPQKQLAAPDAPRFPALQPSREARQASRAVLAHGLRLLHILRRLGEEQLRVLRARKIQARWVRGGGEVRHRPVYHLEPRRFVASDGGHPPLHRCHPLSLAGPSCRPCDCSPSLGPRPYIAKATDPVCGSAASRGVPAGWLGRFSIWRRTRCALAEDGDTGHLDVVIRLLELRHHGGLRGRNDEDSLGSDRNDPA